MVSSIANTNIFICIQLSDFQHCYLTLTVLFATVKWVQ